MSYVSRPDIFERVVTQTLINIETISEGVLEQTTGKELSTAGDTELKGADYLDWYKDLVARGIVDIVLNLEGGEVWVDRWAEKFEREKEKLADAV